ncbi:hypothetical protein [Aurantimonas sp. NFXS3]|uniref:hypothetical protein n=1 Tax=Aurantimonas sp. NFXS3 TaxID=2818434 RepID=UPI003B8D147A
MTPHPTTDERPIREAVVNRINTLLPSAHVIHELDVEGGAGRADVAAVTVDQLWLFEIKSGRDKLHRLSRQVQLFHPACHGLVIVADEKWCGRAANYPNCDVRKVIQFHGAGTLWQWPVGGWPHNHWQLPTPTPPWPLRMLRLLTAAELRGLGPGADIPSEAVIDHLARTLTGHAVTAMVCHVLRQRVPATATRRAA